jgi:hypothetical protein
MWQSIRVARGPDARDPAPAAFRQPQFAVAPRYHVAHGAAAARNRPRLHLPGAGIASALGDFIYLTTARGNAAR